jgi:hypothetical protein
LKALCKPDGECDPIFGVLGNSRAECQSFGCNKPQILGHSQISLIALIDRVPSRTPKFFTLSLNVGVNDINVRVNEFGDNVKRIRHDSRRPLS